MEWYKSIKQNHPQRPHGKLIHKIPMKQLVVTDNHEVWRYSFFGNRIAWFYCCSVKQNKND